MDKPYTESQLLSALRRLERRWPEGYALFDWSGSLHLLRLNKGGGFPDPMRRGATSEAIVDSFLRITSGGGDPD